MDICGSYKALPHPHFGQSDHISLLLRLPGECHQSRGLYIISDITHQKLSWWCGDHRDNKIIPQTESRDEWGPCPEPKKLPFGQEKHTAPPEWDWKLASRRQSGGTGERPQHQQHQRRDGQYRTSQATKAGAAPSCVRPRCQMSLTPFILALISSTKSQLSSLLCFRGPATVSIHSGCEKNPAESEYKLSSGVW